MEEDPPGGTIPMFITIPIGASTISIGQGPGNAITFGQDRVPFHCPHPHPHRLQFPLLANKRVCAMLPMGTIVPPLVVP